METPRKIEIIKSLEDTEIECKDFLPYFIKNIKSGDHVAKFTSYLDSIDWSKADEAQVNDLKSFIKKLMSETKKKDSSSLAEDDGFLDFRSTWNKLIEKCKKVTGKQSSEMLRLAESLENYPTAWKEGYLAEFIMADQYSLLVPFEKPDPDSNVINMASRHRFQKSKDYLDDWNRIIFSTLEEIKENNNSKAKWIYKNVLDLADKSSEFALKELLSMRSGLFVTKYMSGASREEMISAAKEVITRLEPYKNVSYLNK